MSVDDNENINAVISRPSLDTTNRDEENKVRPSTTQRSPKTTTNRIAQTNEEKDDIAMIPSIEARPTNENMNENQDKPNIKNQVKNDEDKKDTVQTVINKVVDKVDSFIINNENKTPSAAKVKVNFTEEFDQTEVQIEQNEEKLKVDVVIPGKGGDFSVDLPIDDNLNIGTDILEEVLDVAIDPSFGDITETAAANKVNNKIIAQTVKEAVNEIIESDDEQELPSILVLNVEKDPDFEEIDVSVEHFDQVIQANISSPGAIKQSEIELILPIVEGNENELKSEIESNLDKKDEVISDKRDSVKTVVDEVVDKVDSFIIEIEDKIPSAAKIKVNFTGELDQTKVQIEQKDEQLQVDVEIPGKGGDFSVDIPIDDKLHLETDILEEVLDVAIDPSFGDITETSAANKVNNKIIAQTVKEAVNEIIESDDEQELPSILVLNVEKDPDFEEIDVSVEHFDQVIQANISSPGAIKQSEIELILPIVEGNENELKSEIESNLDKKDEVISDKRDSVKTVVDEVVDKVDSFIIEIEDKIPSAAKIKVNFTGELDQTKVQIEQKDEQLQVDVEIPGKGGDFSVDIPIDDKLHLETDILEEVLDVAIDPSFGDITETSAANKVNNKIIAQTVKETVKEIIESDNQQKPPSTLVLNVEKGPDFEEIDVSVEHFDQIIRANISSPGEIKQSEIKLVLPIVEVNELKSEIESNLDKKDEVLSDKRDSVQTIVDEVVDNVDSFIINTNDKIPSAAKVKVNFTEKSDQTKVKIEQIDEQLQIDVEIPGKGGDFSVDLPINEKLHLDTDILEEVLDVAIEPSFGDITETSAANKVNNKIIAQTVKDAVDEIIESDVDQKIPSTLVLNVEKGPDFEEIDVSVEHFEQIVQANISSPGEIKQDKIELILPIDEVNELRSEIQSNLDENDEAFTVTTSKTTTSKTADSEFDNEILDDDQSEPFQEPQIIQKTTQSSVKPSKSPTNTKDISTFDEELNKVQNDDNTPVTESSFSGPTKQSLFTATENIKLIDEGQNQVQIDDKPIRTDTITPSLSTDLNNEQSTIKALVAPNEVPASESNIKPQDTTPKTIIKEESDLNEDVINDKASTSSTEKLPLTIDNQAEVVSSTASTTVATKIASVTTSTSKVTSAASISEISTDTSTIATTESTTTTTAAPFFTSGVLARVRDLMVALVAGLIAQTVGFPFSPPARKDTLEGQLINTKPRPPTFNVRDPFIRNKVKESEGAFDGNNFNFSIPISPEEIDELNQDEIKKNISNIVAQAFGPEAADSVQNITVTLGDQVYDDGKIIINAQAAPAKEPEFQNDRFFQPVTNDRPKAPRFEDTIPSQDTRRPLQFTTRSPQVTTRQTLIDLPLTPSPTNIIFPAKDTSDSAIGRTENPYFIPPFVPNTKPTVRSTTARPSTIIEGPTRPSSRIPTTIRQQTRFPSTSNPIITAQSTRTTSSTVRFQINDAVTTRFTTSTRPRLPSTVRPISIPEEDLLSAGDLLNEYGSFESNDVIPPFIPFIPQYPIRDDDPLNDYNYIPSDPVLPVDDNKIFDNRLNFLGKPNSCKI